MLLKKRTLIKTINYELKNITLIEHSKPLIFNHFIVNLRSNWLYTVVSLKETTINLIRDASAQLLYSISIKLTLIYIFHKNPR